VPTPGARAMTGGGGGGGCLFPFFRLLYKSWLDVALGGDRDDDVLLRTLLTKNEGLISALNHEAMVDNQPAGDDFRGTALCSDLSPKHRV
jgi:hypothetical protein